MSRPVFDLQLAVVIRREVYMAMGATLGCSGCRAIARGDGLSCCVYQAQTSCGSKTTNGTRLQPCCSLVIVGPSFDGLAQGPTTDTDGPLASKQEPEQDTERASEQESEQESEQQL